MKKILAILFAAFIAFTNIFAANYKVNVKEFMNLRAEPSTSAEVLVKIGAGETVEGPDIINGTWVKVNYHGTEGYLNAKYLELIEDSVTENDAKVIEKDLDYKWYQLLNWNGYGYEWMAYLIIALALVMWAECKFIRELDFDDFSGNSLNSLGWRIANFSILSIFSIIIVIYVCLMGNRAMWFLTEVRPWYYILVNFIFFLYVIIDVFVFFLRTIYDFAEAAKCEYSIKLGLIGWILGLLAYIICHIFRLDNTMVLYVVGALQLVQVIIILVAFFSKGKYLLGLTACLVYAIGSTAIVLLMLPLMFLCIALIITIIVLCFAFKIGMSPGGVLSTLDGTPNPVGTENASSTPECKVYDIINPEGKSTRLTQCQPDSSVYFGSDGYTYHDYGGTFKRS